LRDEVRVGNGRKKKTSFGIADAQSVKNTEVAEEKGYDAGKKVSGIKRLIIVDTQGLPHAVDELHKFAVLPKRWVVERSFGWLEKFRRLWKNCERTLRISRQVILAAFSLILIKRF
jgi:hypothetical protein